MTNREALHAMLVYARREAEEEKMSAVAHLLSLAVAEIERGSAQSRTEKQQDIRSEGETGQHPLHSRLQ